MRIRTSRVGDRWVGRTVSVTRRNLREYGLPCPAEGKPLSDWYSRRLLSAVQANVHGASKAGSSSRSSAPLRLAEAVCRRRSGSAGIWR